MRDWTYENDVNLWRDINHPFFRVLSCSCRLPSGSYAIVDIILRVFCSGVRNGGCTSHVVSRAFRRSRWSATAISLRLEVGTDIVVESAHLHLFKRLLGVAISIS